MSKREFVLLFLLGFIFFEIIFIRLNFFLHISIGKNTLVSCFVLYNAVLIAILASKYIWNNFRKNYLYSLIVFYSVTLLCVGITYLFSFTYDTSWDGQGYHQIAIIALSHSWNPIYQSTIQLQQHLPGQIFAEGYPSALWEIQASIYALTSNINTAKVTNIYIAICSTILVSIALSKLKFNRWMTAIISAVIVLQPVYLLQLNTFMQDGFGYQLIVMTASSLILLILDQTALWALSVFVVTEILLMSTKYSHLPAALIFGGIFALVIINRFMNKIYKINKYSKISITLLLTLSLFFAYLPYIRNQISYNSLFYPTNIPDLMGSVVYNNAPNNVDKKDKPALLFYGIFSKSQSSESGAPEAKSNIAQLKVPFTFSFKEITDSVSLYNNRVGAAGPLFSGIIILTTLFLLCVMCKVKNRKQRYAVYISCLIVNIILFLSILSPTPNLLRYVNQLQLLPFAIIIPIYAVIKNKYTTASILTIIALLFINNTVYATAVIQRNLKETTAINQQFINIKKSDKHLYLAIQQFYSNYTILNEQKIKFTAVTTLDCTTARKFLVASSNTSIYCLE